MEYVPDNFDRFEDHESAQQEWIRSRPVCDCCGEYIQDESYHQIMGEKICDRCLDGMIVYVEEE